MGITVAEYEDTPALTVDWDLALHDVELRVEKTLQERAAKT